MKLIEFVFAGEGDIRYVAASAGLARDTLAQVIDDHIVEARPTGGTSRVEDFGREDAIEDFDYVQNADLEVGLFV